MVNMVGATWREAGDFVNKKEGAWQRNKMDRNGRKERNEAQKAGHNGDDFWGNSFDAGVDAK